MFKKHIYEIGAYKPPLEGRNPKDYLLLDFNERTIPVSPAVKQAIVEFVNEERIQVYPSYGDLTEKISNYVGVDERNLMITNGSDQGIDIIIRATCSQGDEAIIPFPSFYIYRQSSLVEGLKIIEPAYTEDYNFPVDEILNLVNEKTRLIIAPNPNNPTGTAIPAGDILKIARNVPHAAILVDECYFEYCGITVKDEIETYKNILITRTFSKTWGLPSVRVGYIMTARDNIEQLLKVRGPYDVNMFAVVAVGAALDDLSFMRRYVTEITDKSRPLLENFLAGKKISFWPANANFILTLPDDPEILGNALRDRGILVRPQMGPGGKMGLRMTVGTVEQTEKLIEILDELI